MAAKSQAKRAAVNDRIEDSEPVEVDDEAAEAINGPHPPTRAEILPGYTPEDVIEIDAGITKLNLLTILYAELKRIRVAGHHIDSMNSFLDRGLRQIIIEGFSVEGHVVNPRDSTAEDREIVDVAYKMKFTAVRVEPPQNFSKQGVYQKLTPNLTRLMNLNYMCKVFASATISLTANRKTGPPIETTDTLTDYMLGSIPCATGTNMCITSDLTNEHLQDVEEDPHAPRGGFIIHGGEWLIDPQENIRNNALHVHQQNGYGGEHVRGNFLSKPGDNFENSSQVNLRLHTDGAITVELTKNKTEKYVIPWYMVFRSVGIVSDRDMFNHVVYGVDNTDKVTRAMLQILLASLEAPSTAFAEIKHSRTAGQIAQFISNIMIKAVNESAKRKNANVQKYTVQSYYNMIDRLVFPHIGVTEAHRVTKMRFLGHIINRLLAVHLGIVPPTNRDSFRNKRILAAGTTSAKDLKQKVNIALILPIRKALALEIRSTPFSSIKPRQCVEGAIAKADLEKLMTQSITASSKPGGSSRLDVVSRVSATPVYQKNHMALVSAARNITVANMPTGKGTERATEMRMPPAAIGIDPTQSADSGVKVGATKQLGCSTSISSATSSGVLKARIRQDPWLIELNGNLRAEDISALSKVFVNGDWIGCCRHPHMFVWKYRHLRRRLVHEGPLSGIRDISRMTTICHDVRTNDIEFYVDVGRVMTPMIIVYNNIEEFDAGTADTFHQWIKLTKDHIRGMWDGTVTIENLLKLGVLEHLACDEFDNTYLAENIEVLRRDANDYTRQYTHMAIEQAIYGLPTLACALMEFSNSTRNTYFTNHRRQAASIYATNYPFRMDKNVTLAWAVEMPLISTFTDAITYPACQNVIVCIALYDGINAEDSLQVNRSSICCGMFNATFYNTEVTTLEAGESFAKPDHATTMDIKREANYSHIDGDYIKRGSQVVKNDVIIVKVARVPKATSAFAFRDRSIVYKRTEPARVECVITGDDYSGTAFIKVKLRSSRPLNSGDKLASRTGNKGIVGATVPRSDMPYCADGLIPDIIVNCHSIPTRMAINQIIESMLGCLAAEKGAHNDATAFIPPDVYGSYDELAKFGIQYGGLRRMFNGHTGEWIDTMMFVGPTSYQRLTKYAEDEKYAMHTGPTSPLTHQLLAGRQAVGGLRLGEMEKDAEVAQAAMRPFFTKFNKDSDGVECVICKKCGRVAIINVNRGIYRCINCGDAAEFERVLTTWAANVHRHTLAAINVSMRFVTQQRVFPDENPDETPDDATQ